MHFWKPLKNALSIGQEHKGISRRHIADGLGLIEGCLWPIKTKVSIIQEGIFPTAFRKNPWIRNSRLANRNKPRGAYVVITERPLRPAAQVSTVKWLNQHLLLFSDAGIVL